MRKPSAYRKGRNLANFARSVIELDRAEHVAEAQRQRAYDLVFSSGDKSREVGQALNVFRLVLLRCAYAKANVTRYGERLRG